ncbi:flagellar hook-basal body complex protein FliE [Buchnera aphidicola]|uniref:Flagellar hook-basal body complex protein FliE n=1 Tax=Buchnera aphidicola subsp. Melaphis rhois TaxID=118103 RepID=A0A4D6Y0P2_BUCMH|nr:flagellar hook-basal body complex protein FliE [Buchnera aphidicola]QCI23106.1 flagellar hook-basal body complex protein FliE [Buchnera aphidicola (Melaphis rhois)]
MSIDTMKDSLDVITTLGSLLDVGKIAHDISQKFTDHVKDAFNLLSFNQKETEKESENLELNKNEHTTLNDVIMNLQQSLISTDTIVQVRDKLVSGCKELLNLQI